MENKSTIHSDRRLADYGMIFDRIGDFTDITVEAKVIDKIFELFTMLCAPFIGGRGGELKSNLPYIDRGIIKNRLMSFDKDYAWTVSGKGFVLPIKSRDKILGILEVDEIAFSEYKEHYLNLSHLNLSLAIAGFFGLAISNARKYQKIKRAEEKIKQDYYIQSTISAILHISLKPISIEEQLERILDLILSTPLLVLQAKGCIYLVENDPNVLVMKAHRQLSESLLTICAEVPFGRCLCGLAASTRKIVFADCVDGRHEIRYQGILPHGHYCVPIRSDDRVLGVICMYISEGHKRHKREGDFLSAVADTLAGIIERKRIESEKRELQEQLHQSEKLSALGRLTANVAHEIRNPLTVLGGFARRLNRKISDGKKKEYCELIISETSRLERILRNVLTFSHEVRLYIEEHNINEIVNETLIIYEDICDEQSISIHKSFGDIPQIQIDKDQAKQAIDNLISNAIDSMPKN
jgi:K+-sensing histidine kinase KdpD